MRDGCEFMPDPNEDLVIQAMKNTDKRMKIMHQNFIKSKPELFELKGDKVVACG